MNIDTFFEQQACPDMKAERREPGAFVTKDKNTLYIFGGKENSFERIQLNGAVSKEELEIIEKKCMDQPWKGSS